MHVVDANALLAADVAAPVEDAMAFLLPLLRPRVVAAATAQQITAVDAVRGDIASPVPGAEGARLWVGFTKVGGVLIIDEVPLGGGLEERILGPQSLHPASGFPVLLDHHLGGAVVLVLEEVANGAEVGLGPPTGLHLTAARQAMAFALQVHVVQDGLGKKEQQLAQTDPPGVPHPQWKPGSLVPPQAPWQAFHSRGICASGTN